MYLKRIHLENVGPIAKLDYNMPFDATGNPKPLVLVGPNGSGKSIVLSFVVNSLLAAHQEIYENSEVQRGKVYKYRAPEYLRSGSKYYFANLHFEEAIEVAEWQLAGTKQSLGAGLSRPEHPSWDRIPADTNSIFWSTMNRQHSEIEQLFARNCVLYFPANRFEEPGWLNRDNLTRRPEFLDVKNIQGISNRTVIQHSPLSQNRNWLLDVQLDKHLYETMLVTPREKMPKGANLPWFVGHHGAASTLDIALNNILKLVLQADESQFLIERRKNRSICVKRAHNTVISNIFQLSTGETAVLNLFLSIMRDYDMSGAEFKTLQDVRGIVVVDEIDTHLHTELQSNVLPQLIKLFPRVQFILTSHSPLFLLGLRRVLTEDGFAVLELPSGQEISVERFTEFQRAYDRLKETTRHEQEIAAAITNSQLPVVFVEGDYDIRYLTKAAEFLGRESVLKRVTLEDAGGYGTLNGVWNKLDAKVCRTLAKKTILIYDCDVDVKSESRGMATRRTIPTTHGNPIGKGIENLFSSDTITKVREASNKFIDVTPAISKLVRGQPVEQAEVLEVNKDEKKNLCTWLCDNGTADDFAGFTVVFDTIEEALSDGK